MTTGAANRPYIAAILGGTGSGKTTWVKRYELAARPQRLLVWDFSPVDEYATLGHAVTWSELVEELAAAKGRPFALVVKPDVDPVRRAAQFDLFCNAAFAAGNCTVIVEELRFVTRPSWAPVPWQRCILQGRKTGLRLIGTSQRPAHIDKDFLGNATRIHTGMLSYRDDRLVVAAELDVPAEELGRLQPLDWIDLDRTTRVLTRGKIVI